MLCKPGAITPHTEFKAEVYMLTKEKAAGIRRSSEVPSAVLFPHDRRDGQVRLPAGVEMVMPGDNVAMEVEADHPGGDGRRLRFAIREGGRTVGAGVVAEHHRVT